MASYQLHEHPGGMLVLPARPCCHTLANGLTSLALRAAACPLPQVGFIANLHNERNHTIVEKVRGEPAVGPDAAVMGCM